MLLENLSYSHTFGVSISTVSINSVPTLTTLSQMTGQTYCSYVSYVCIDLALHIMLENAVLKALFLLMLKFYKFRGKTLVCMVALYFHPASPLV